MPFTILWTLLIVSCAPRTRRTPDDTLVYIFERPITELDPRFIPSSTDLKVSRLVAAGLVIMDQASLEPRLDLAESIDRVDPVTWDVTLRQGLLFSDGSPLTAEDVVYTFESALDPKLGSFAHSMYKERIVWLKALDERRVRFRLKKPLATFVSDLDFGILPKKITMGLVGQRWSNGSCVGAGPYRVKSITSTVLTLERNEHYHGKRPKMDKLEFKGVRNTNARMIIMVGGSADITQNTVRLDLIDDARKSPRLRIISGPSVVLTYMMMHNEDPILKDVRVRRAIAYAIDRAAIVRHRLGGHAQLATGLIAPTHWAYSSDVKTYAFDPARARKLLDEAGYPDPDGDGPKKRFSLTYKTSADGFRVSLARVIARQLGEVGIDVEVRPFERAVFFGDIKQGSFQLASMQTSSIMEPDMYTFYYHSRKIPSKEFPNVGNRWRYRNSTVDQWIDQGRHELDQQKRKTIYANIQRQLSEDVPVVPLWHEDNIALMNVDIEGFDVLPNARLYGLANVRRKPRKSAK